MEADDFIIIAFKDVKYRLNLKKLQMILSILANKKIEIKTADKAKMYLKEYCLYHEGFLNNINKV